MSAGPGRGLFDRLGLGRPELRAWAMYDWANSAMVTIVITAVFPPFYGAVAAEGIATEVAQSRYSFATALSLGIVAVLAPVLGAIADYRAVRKRLLAFFACLGVLGSAGLFLVGPGDWLLALVLFGIANAGAGGSIVFYDSLLPHVARQDEVDRVSTAGYALGYLGGGLLLAVHLLVIQKPGWFGLPEGDLPVRLGFLAVAVWWLLFTLPVGYELSLIL